AGMVFRLMFGETDNAAANQIMHWLGLSSVDWRYHAWSGMLLMVLLCCWRWMGVNILYFLAALQNVPKELFEAADIDGANRLQKFRFVTLPFLKPVTIFVTTISIINGYRMLEESFVFWEAGSPGNIGLTVVGYIYQQGIQHNNQGYGAAIGVVLMIIIFIVSFIRLVRTGACERGDGQVQKRGSSRLKWTVSIMFVIISFIALFPILSLLLCSCRPSSELLRNGIRIQFDISTFSLEN